MSAGLFPPLPPDVLVFTPGDPAEFRRLVEKELGGLEEELGVVEQEEQAMINQFALTVGELELLEPDVAEVGAVREEIGSDPVHGEREQVLAAVNAGEADLAQLIAIAGLLPDERVPPPPPNPNPTPAAPVGPPTGGGGGAPGGGQGPPAGGEVCVFSDIEPAGAGWFSPSPGVWCLQTGGLPPPLP